MSNRGKILLIDDEPLLADTIALFLGDDFDLFYADGGEAGLLLASQVNPDLILLDVGMPDINGLDVCRRLKSDQSLTDIPVIFLTAYGSVVDEMEGLRAGAVDYISKPFHAQIEKARVSVQCALKLQRDELRTLVRLDELTQISNRRHFEECFAIEWRRAYRYQSPVSVLLIDVDAFNTFNDTYGHMSGDECLRDVAQRLKKAVCRSGDLMARFGGEEFVGLLPRTPERALNAVGSRLLEVIEEAQIPHENSPAKDIVTISIGAAATIPRANDDMTDLLARANRALYCAKRAGGNQISVDYLSSPANQTIAVA